MRQDSGKGGKRLEKETKGQTPRSGSAPRKQKQKSNLSTKKKVLRVLFIILVAICSLIVVGAIFLHFFAPPPEVALPDRPQTTVVVDKDGVETEIPMADAPALSADRKKQFYTFLLYGLDQAGGHTDTMMLVAYDVPNQKLSVMSLPRDTFVSYKGKRVMLNNIRATGGGGEKGDKALRQAVDDLTGVYPDFTAVIQWEAFGKLVEAIGGVEFDVPLTMYYNDKSQNFKIDVKKGLQTLNGDEAMGVIRWRHNSIGDTGKIDYSYGYADGDIGRIKTQQGLMGAIIKKCLQPNVLLPNLTEYVKIFQENVETDLTASNVTYFVKSAVGGLKMDNVNFVTMPYKAASNGAQVLAVGSELLKAINADFNPYKDDLRLSELKIYTESGSSSSSSKTTAGPKATAKATAAPEESAAPESVQPSNAASPAASAPAASAQPGNSQAPAATAAPTTAPTPPPASNPTTPPAAVSTPAPPAGDEPLLPPGA